MRVALPIATARYLKIVAMLYAAKKMERICDNGGKKTYMV